MNTFKKSLLSISTAAAILTAGVANAGIIKIDEAAFNPEAGLITFSEFSLGTSNPVYNPADYGGGARSPVVTFGGFFDACLNVCSATC